jgi:hypothetical protein
MWPMPIATIIGPSCQWLKVTTGKRYNHLHVATMNLKICNFSSEFPAYLWYEIREQSLCSNWYFYKKIERLVGKDKSMPTPINFYRVDILLSSTVDSCCLGTIRIFNIVGLHFREQGGTNLLLFVALLGHWQVGRVALATGRWWCSPIVTVILSSNGPCDVTLTHWYYDRALLSVT